MCRDGTLPFFQMVTNLVMVKCSISSLGLYDIHKYSFAI